MSSLARIAVLVSVCGSARGEAVRAAIRSRAELRVIDEDDASPDTVVVVVTERLDMVCAERLRRLGERAMTRIVLVADELDESDVVVAVRHGVRALARRGELDTGQLVRLVLAARSGHSVLPPDLLGRLIGLAARPGQQFTRPAARSAAFSRRETAVLRLLADGLSTGEIANTLCYSERTIKGIVHDVTERFSLRNRSHAVAFAVREGVI